ncbi:MAG: WD40 repeat domain-containing protein [Planctomycetota bacterium]
MHIRQRPWLGLLILLCAVSCSKKENSRRRWGNEAARPSLELQVEGSVGTVSTFRGILQAPGQNGFLHLWQWENLAAGHKKVKVERWYPRREYTTPVLNRGSTLLSPECVIYTAHSKEDTHIVIRDIEDDSNIERKPFGKRWFCEQLRSTRNGKYIAVYLRELYRYVLEDDEREDRGERRFGVIESLSGETQWVSCVYKTDSTLAQLNQVAVSEDGKYFAAVGTSNGGFIHLAGVEEKRVLWEKVPHGKEVPLGDWTVNFNDVCFSPDGKYVYVAGNCGLFCFDVSTGRILSQWLVDGGLCQSVDVSPDGRLVAGGVDGSGLVSIYEAKTGKLLRLLQTGQYSVYGLTFSPDSTRLATSGVKRTNIKIWKMPTLTPSTEKDDRVSEEPASSGGTTS